MANQPPRPTIRTASVPSRCLKLMPCQWSFWFWYKFLSFVRVGGGEKEKELNLEREERKKRGLVGN